MKFGAAIPISHQGVYLPTPFAHPDDLTGIVQLAERLGFYSAWGLDFMTLTDDPVPAESEWPEWHEVLTSLAFIAARTKTIRLGTGSLQLPLRDPFLVAKQAATVDVLSGGRMMLVVGLGVYRTEFQRMYPRVKAHRGAMFEEYLEVMHRFFTEGAVSFEGEYYACEQLAMLPKPIQTPFPIYMMGTVDTTFDRIAKFSSGWLLSRAQTHLLDQRLEALDAALERFGRHRSEIDIVCTKGLSLGKTREEAFARFYECVLPERMDHMAGALKTGEGKPSQDTELVLEQNLIGTVDDVLEQIDQQVTQKGINHCVIYYNPVTNMQQMQDQIQWFGEAVVSKSSMGN